MEANTAKLEQQMKRFEKTCRDSGIKVTHQRMEIFREVARSGDHPDAEMVHQGVRERMPTVSLDTVYRTLWMLHDLGLITTLSPHSGRSRFDANLGQHHHFVCVRCGLTRDFYSDEFNAIKPPASIKALGRAQATHVEVRGVCLECAAKEE